MTGREHVHLIGIGGTGLSAIARVLHARGIRISGCDRQTGPEVARLQQLGIPVHLGHGPQHLKGVTLVLRSSAVPPDHPEVQAARERDIPVLTRNRFLPWLTQGYRSLAVAGTHGKTTTTAMLAWALLRLGRDPSYIVGGTPVNTGVNGYAGSGPYFVIEADEYDHMFLGLEPYAGILTYVDYDHPDFFPDQESYLQAFRAFLQRFPQDALLVFWHEDARARELVAQASHLRARSFGLEEGADYRAVEVQPTPQGTRFRLVYRGRALVPVTLSLPGTHNVRNALAVLALLHGLGEEVQAAARALAEFQGVERRFTWHQPRPGWVLVNDYGHHPVEIQATLEAVRQRFPNHTVWAVWQPHTYSRTLRLLPQFAQALRGVDGLVLLPVYPAREQPPPGFHQEQVIRAVAHPKGVQAENWDQAVEILLQQARPPVVVVLFSAGDAPALLDLLTRTLQGSPATGEVQHAG